MEYFKKLFVFAFSVIGGGILALILLPENAIEAHRLILSVCCAVLINLGIKNLEEK